MHICILKLKVQTLYSFYSSISKLIAYTHVYCTLWKAK